MTADRYQWIGDCVVPDIFDLSGRIMGKSKPAWPDRERRPIGQEGSPVRWGPAYELRIPATMGLRNIQKHERDKKK